MTKKCSLTEVQDSHNAVLEVKDGDKDSLIALLESWQGLASLLPGNIYFKDTQGTYLWCNKQLADLLKFKSSSQIIGKNDYDFLKKDMAQKIIDNDWQVTKQGVALHIEEWGVNVKNVVTPYMTSKIPVCDEKKKVIGLLGVSIDISDRKKAEKLQLEKLQLEKQTTRQLTHALEMIAGSVAHDIKTPLAVIGINADNLHLVLKKSAGVGDKINNDNKLLNYLANIKRAIGDVNCIMSMLLVKLYNTFKLNSKREEFFPITIKQSIDDALREYPYRGHERDLIEWDGTTNSDFIYIGSGLLTKHIIFNLIKNSLRAIKEVESGKICISIQAKSDYNCLIFKDTATGIPAAKLESIFELFTSDIQVKGMGLGLTFCEKIMREYGGDITCRSQEGKYTEFTLKFPVIKKTK